MEKHGKTTQTDFDANHQRVGATMIIQLDDGTEIDEDHFMRLSKVEMHFVKEVHRGFYEINDDGTIWRLKKRIGQGRGNHIEIHIEPEKVETVSANGYIMLYNGDYKISAHRLIWIWFWGEIKPKYHIHHIDGDKLNNAIDNLEMLSPAEHNTEHSIRSIEFDEKVINLYLLHKNVPKVASIVGTTKATLYYLLRSYGIERRPGCNAKLSENQVREIRLLKGQKSVNEISEQYGMSYNAINSILKRESWKHIK